MLKEDRIKEIEEMLDIIGMKYDELVAEREHLLRPGFYIPSDGFNTDNNMTNKAKKKAKTAPVQKTANKKAGGKKK